MSSDPARAPSDPGLFGPRSVAWELCRERSVAAMAPRAVILQYAHPAFAAASHAYAATGRFERALRTLSETVFADRETALAHARRVCRMHARLKGRTDAGLDWSATDPDALAWVLVTLLDATVRGTELVRGRLPDPRVARFLAEARDFGALYGVRPDDVPVDRAALDRRVDDAVRSVLVVGPEVHALWRWMVGDSPYGPLLARWIGATLPPEIALALGTPRRLSRPLLRGARWVGALVRLAPERVRYTSLYRTRAAAFDPGRAHG